jgi:8-oxo-dGTP pyrophosphatase MutT (NUDIX family)
MDHGTQKRVRAVIVENGSLLLVHRIKKERDYYVFPGGGVEDGETDKEALVREAMEELGVAVEVGNQFAVCEPDPSGGENQTQIFYECRITGGKLGTGTGPEFQPENSYRGTYAFEWVPCAELGDRAVFPEEVKRLFL